jgi:hypothetical protein
MKHPQCNTHPIAQLQLELESVASLSGNLACCVPLYNCGFKMVAHIKEVVAQYEQRVRSLQKVPRFSCGRRMVGAYVLFF